MEKGGFAAARQLDGCQLSQLSCEDPRCRKCLVLGDRADLGDCRMLQSTSACLQDRLSKYMLVTIACLTEVLLPVEELASQGYLSMATALDESSAGTQVKRRETRFCANVPPLELMR